MSDKIKQFQGTIMEQGYGIVAKMVMKDTNLSVTAKAIYAYLATYGDGSFPSRNLITHDLGITKDTYSKHLNQLLDIGYITIEQVKNSGGQFAHNVYYINQILSPSPRHKIYDTVESSLPCHKKPDTVKPDTVNYDTNNTSSNNTNSNNTTTKKKTVAAPVDKIEMNEHKSKLIASMKSIGISEKTTLAIFKKYKNDLVRIENQYRLLKNKIDSGKEILDVNAYLVAAVKENYSDINIEKSKIKSDALKKSAEFDKKMQAKLESESKIDEPIQNEFFKARLDKILNETAQALPSIN